jgi:hypothetical protein
MHDGFLLTALTMNQSVRICERLPLVSVDRVAAITVALVSVPSWEITRAGWR